MTLDGYINCRIPGKAELKGIADIDIEATNSNTGLKTLVQVKHHKGKTSAHGLKQLSAVTDENAELWLITSASLSDHAKKYALKHSIKVIEGSKLVSWIYSKQAELSAETRQRLGISSIPTLLI
jgi:restriction system protein